MSLEDKRRRRLQFMKALYEQTDGRELATVDMWELGHELGFSRDDTEATTEYLVGEYLMEYAALGDAISITHLGVREVEESMQNPRCSDSTLPPNQCDPRRLYGQLLDPTGQSRIDASLAQRPFVSRDLRGRC